LTFYVGKSSAAGGATKERGWAIPAATGIGARQMAEIGGRPVEIAVFAVILGVLIGGIVVAIIHYFMI
jgi:hypothetical protein